MAGCAPSPSSADPIPTGVEDLDQLCLDSIARYKRPKAYRFVDNLPTNNYGKVLKRELRELLEAESTSDPDRP